MPGQQELMTCGRAQELVPLLILTGGEIEAPGLPELREHLQQCAACAEFHERSLQAALARGELPVSEMPREVRAKLEQLERDFLPSLRALSLLRKAVVKEEWGERYARWMEVLHGQAGGALSIELREGEARLTTEGTEALVGSPARWQFREALRSQPRAAPSLALSDTPRKRGQPGPGCVEIVAPGAPSLAVRADGQRNEIEVHVLGLAPGERAPLVALVPAEGQAEAIVLEPKPAPEGEGRVARFPNLWPGKHTLLLEP